MRGKRIRRFTIHILAIPAINPDIMDLPAEKTALIACTPRSNKFLNLFPPGNTLIMPFADVEIKGASGAIDHTHARIIIKFLSRLPREVTDLYICCSKGASRSPALAAAVLRMSGRNDKVIWDNPFYSPNTLVYQTICREFGLFAPTLYVKYLQKRNSGKYQEAVKNGHSSGFERWQIIE